MKYAFPGSEAFLGNRCSAGFDALSGGGYKQRVEVNGEACECLAAARLDQPPSQLTTHRTPLLLEVGVCGLLSAVCGVLPTTAPTR
jgi:hypothetical protein